MKSRIALQAPISSLRSCNPYRRCTGNQAGIALILTLAVLVLISALVLAFLSTALLHRQISFSSSGQNRADILAKTAMDTVLGDFTSEIQAGSTSYTSNNVVIYIPNNYSTNAATMVPFRTVVPALTNLITVSQGGTNFWSTSGSSYSPQTGPARASSDSHYLVTAPAANGRYLPINGNSWLKPQLLDSSVASQFPTPSWIMITRQGPVTSGVGLPSVSAMANATPTNMNYAIGRYAYAVYDVGGLVDVNAAGNGFGLNSTQNAQRGRLQQAALSQLPLADSTANDAANVAAAKSLIAWRSPVGQNDTSWLFNATNTFMNVDPAGSTPTTSDQAFLSRQDLLQYFQTGQSGLNANALQYLTVFTRELNQPSYTPPPLTTATFPNLPFPSSPTSYQGTKPKLQGATQTSSAGFAYGVGNGSLTTGGAVPSGLDGKFNPSLVNIRDPSGTGNPIFKQRFPLSRLAWITSNGPSATLPSSNSTITQLLADHVSQQTINNGTAVNIKTYFGLVWDGANHQWIYTSPEGNTGNPPLMINTLGNIPNTRTTGPDFFETLMSAIDIGSLGRDAGPPHNSATGKGMISNVFVEDQNVYRHILQIGANIIDQARPDDFPTAFRLGVPGTSTTMVVYGIKNLPYLTRLSMLSVNDYKNYNLDCYLAPEVWNPHQQIAANTPPSNARPTSIRIRACSDPDNPETVTSPCNILLSPGGSSPPSDTVTTDLHAQNPIQFALPSLPALTPTLLTSGNSTGGSAWSSSSYKDSASSLVYASIFAYTTVSSSTALLYGFSCGQVTAQDTATGTSTLSNIPAYHTQHYAYQPSIAASPSNSFIMEYSPDGTNWYPYSATRNIQSYWQSYSGPYGSDPSSAVDQFNGRCGTELHIDPRTDRFGLLGRYSNSGYLGGLEYDVFTSQTLWHFYSTPPNPNSVVSGDTANPNTASTDSFVAADWRFVGENGPFPASLANDGNGGSSDTSGGGAFHLQATWAISAAALSNSLGAPGTGKYLETIAENIGTTFARRTTQASANYYYDADGLVRPAAGAYGTLTYTADGRPMAQAPFTGMAAGSSKTTYTPATSPTPYTMTTSSQPIMLDRPYRSVGELGYVFRDIPWKDIDFFTTYSGDSALLDVFSIDDALPINPDGTSAATTRYPIVAGKINLNTRNSTALQALLMGAVRDDSSTAATNQISQTGTAGDVTGLANLLITRTSNTTTNGQGPLTSKADLVMRFVGDLTSSTSATVVSGSSSAPDWIIKARREAAIRALADAGNVRTWNLMIDVVVQAGKYTSTATTGDQFVVEGERHYWLHVALDRFTGQIVDELLEPVYD